MKNNPVQHNAELANLNPRQENASIGACFNSITHIMIIHWSGKKIQKLQGKF